MENSCNSRQGSALLLTILITSLLLTIVLSLTLMVRNGLREVESRQLHAQLESNARLSAHLALAALQKAAGPDQRVTSTADIRTNTHLTKARYTVVWDSDPASATYGQQVDQLSSRSNRNVAESLTTASASSAPVLVSARSTNPAVQAEEIAITDSSGTVIGSYAWWVGDEGVKARVNVQDVLRDPADSDGFTDADALNRFQSAQSVGIQWVNTARFSDYDPTDSGMEKISELQELEFQLADQQIDEDFFHTLTPYARSILTNTREGGLKKDLTHLFENDAAFNREFDPSGNRQTWNEDFIFRPEGATDGWNNQNLSRVGAPNWGVLRDYYLSYQDVNNGSFQTTQFNNLLPDGSGIAPWKNSYVDDNLESFQSNSPVHAVIAFLQISVGVEYVRSNTTWDGTNPGFDVYYPRIHMRPIVGLYNPYDVKLNTEDYFVAWSYRPLLTLDIGASSVEMTPEDLIPENTVSGTRFRWRFNNVDLQPGETRLFSLNDRFHLTSNSSDANMAANFNEQGSYYVDLTRDAGIGVAASLSSSEKDDLEFIDDGITPEPTLDVTIEFFRQWADISGIIWNKIGSTMGGDTYQMFQGPYSSGEDPSKMPAPVTRSFNLSDLKADSDGDLTTPSIATFRMTLRGSETTFEPFRFLVDGNPRAFDNGVAVDVFTSSSVGLSYMGIFVGEAPATLEPNIADLGRYTTPWGPDNSASAAGNVTLFHVPRTPLLSTGYLQHANMSKHSFEPTYMVGNGYAPIRIPLDATRSALKVNPSDPEYKIFLDFSHEINRRLWDGYYFSSIPQNLSSTDLTDWTTGNLHLPNSRYRFYEPSSTDATTVADLTDDADALTAERVASRLLVEGGFNINSTSVEAWKAIFASMNHLEVPYYDPDTGALVNTSTLQAQPFLSRTGAPSGRNFWNGYREFSDQEIQNFAQEMVDEIQARGPFLSLGDFLNRDPDSATPEYQRRSPLQAVLDRSVNSSSSPAPNDAGGRAFSEVRGQNAQPVLSYTAAHNSGDAQGMGFPGWVLQGDVMQPLAPILSARSDTFLIRARGSMGAPGAADQKHAWLEMVVQRVPDPVVDGTVSDADLIDVSTNLFGRRFRIVRTRWLQEDEI